MWVQVGPVIQRSPLEAHITQEDDVLFPADARASGGDGLVAQFEAEHRDILALRDELLAARDRGDDRQLGVVAARLAELLGDHMRREDMMLFPSAREILSRRKYRAGSSGKQPKPWTAGNGDEGPGPRGRMP